KGASKLAARVPASGQPNVYVAVAAKAFPLVALLKRVSDTRRAMGGQDVSREFLYHLGSPGKPFVHSGPELFPP
ncbi:unnamed protein product, partial [Prorocentrum cordatum]